MQRRRGGRRLAALRAHGARARPRGRPRAAARARRCARATCGTRSARPPGRAPTPASSSTTPSTSGTPARPTAAINASNPCSEYMFLDDTACNLASLNLMRFDDAGAAFDVETFRHASRLWTLVLEISVLMAQFPSREIAERQLRLPHARPRLRQPRRAADGAAACPTTRPRPSRCAARSPRSCTSRRYATSRRDRGASSGRSPATTRTATRCCAWCATTAAPPTRPGERLRGADRRAGRASTRRTARAGAAGRGPRRRRPRAGARRAARLPQRAGHADRAHRHDRPGHGLRHDGHRARLRAREVQEARRRRLLQDHQRARCRRRSARLGYTARQIDAIVRYAVGAGTLARLPAPQPGEPARARASTTTPSPASRRRCRAPSTSLRVQPLHARRRDHRRAPGRRAGPPRRAGLRPADGARLRGRGDRGGQRLRLRHDDRRGRAAPEGRAPAGVRLRQPLRQAGQAVIRAMAHIAHDGGRAAVPLRRDLQDHQPAERRDHRGRRRVLPRLSGS